MDFLGFWICCSPLNSAQNDTKFASIPFFSRYLPFFALSYQTIIFLLCRGYPRGSGRDGSLLEVVILQVEEVGGGAHQEEGVGEATLQEEEGDASSFTSCKFILYLFIRLPAALRYVHMVA